MWVHLDSIAISHLKNEKKLSRTFSKVIFFKNWLYNQFGYWNSLWRIEFCVGPFFGQNIFLEGWFIQKVWTTKSAANFLRSVPLTKDRFGQKIS